VKKIAADS